MSEFPLYTVKTDVDCLGIKTEQIVEISEAQKQILIHKADVKGFERAITKLSEQTWTKLLTSGKLDTIPEIRRIRERTMKKVFKHMWITVNPEYENLDQQYVTNNLIKQVQKYCSKKNVLGAAWTYEQTGTTEETMGHHPHAHILIEFKEVPAPSDFDREIKNTFKNICDVRKDGCLNIRKCEPEHTTRRISYLYKVGREERPDIIMNELWRTKNNFQKIYLRGSISEKNSEKLDGCESSEDEDMD